MFASSLSTRSRTSAVCEARSTNLICIWSSFFRQHIRERLVVRLDRAAQPRWVADHDGAFGYIARDDRAGADHGARPDSHAAKNHASASDGCAPPHHRCLHPPIGLGLWGTVRGGCPRRPIVDENDAVTDKDLIFDGHARTDE